MISSLFAALLIGIVAGMRSMMAPAAVAWAASGGTLALNGTWLSFVQATAARYVFTALAAGELVGDKLPITPSRKSVGPFAARLVSGALCGAVLASASHDMLVGAVAGIVGAVIGTLGGYEVRVRAARAVGRDLPVAVAEDVIALVIAATAIALV